MGVPYQRYCYGLAVLVGVVGDAVARDMDAFGVQVRGRERK